MICPECKSEFSESLNCPVCGWKDPDSVENQGTVPVDPHGTITEPKPVAHSREDQLNQNGQLDEIRADVATASDGAVAAGTISKSQVAAGTGNSILSQDIRFQAKELTVKFESGDKQVAQDLTPAWSINPLPPLAAVLEFDSETIAESLDRFEKAHLLVISCFAEEVARHAAECIVARLDIEADHRKLLLFERDSEDSNQDIYALQMLGEEINNKVLVVDASDINKASRFVYSLSQLEFNGFQNLFNQLRNIHSYLICLVEPSSMTRLAKASAEAHFPCWRIPFLSNLLRIEYSKSHLELYKRILQQQSLGRLSKDEGSLYVELRPYFHNQQLPVELTRRECEVESIDVRSRYDWSNPLTSTLLYTATYFPNLSPSDFNRVVLRLLGDRTITIPPSAPTAPVSGQGSPVVEERLLTQLWRESPDTYLRECELRALTTSGRTKILTFSNTNIGEKLREHFEEELPFDLENKFESVVKQALIFDKSDAVAENAMRLFFDVMEDYPFQYGAEWLWSELANDVKEPASSAFVFKRISDLLRGMLQNQHLKPIVDDLLELMIRQRQHRSVWDIVRRLQFAPFFDGYYWLRQLLDRGGVATSDSLYAHVYGLVKRQDANIYEVLEKLKVWLPEPDREPHTYSPSNRAALSLMMHYCLESLAEFDESEYGSWPSRYPLFGLSTIDAAHSNLGFLAQWLFHPGMKAVLNVPPFLLDRDECVGALLVGWAFIILGEQRDDKPNVVTTRMSSQTMSEDAQLKPDEVLAILLEEIARVCTQAQQKLLLKQWGTLKDMVTLKLDLNPMMNSKQRAQHRLQRTLIKQLIKQFMAARKSAEFLQTLNHQAVEGG